MDAFFVELDLEIALEELADDETQLLQDVDQTGVSRPLASKASKDTPATIKDVDAAADDEGDIGNRINSPSKMSGAGYDVVVDVDEEGDLGHTDLQEDLEFHPSNFNTDSSNSRKIPGGSPGLPPPATASSGSSKRFLWTLSFYAQFFDVDTNSVLSRCWAAIYPRANFLDVLEGNPDLYGPVWIATTVIFILFLGGTISKYLAETKDATFVYDFTLLSGAAGLIYGYTLVIPIALFLALKYFGSESANLLECWALYGYSNLIWIPVALISWSQISILNWVFVGVGFGVSVAFLLRNLYPVLSATDKQTSKALLILVVCLHAGLAIAIKILFFAHGSPVHKEPGDATPAEPSATPTPPTRFLTF